MSTVHKHFPITSRPGGSWGQGPQVVSNPLWGNRRRRRQDGVEDLESNKQFERKFSTRSDVQVFVLKMIASFSRVWWWRWQQAACPHRSTGTCVIMVTMDGGSFGSHCNRRCQAFQACLLITPPGRERSQSRVPSQIDEGQQGGPLTGWLTDMLLLVSSRWRAGAS